MSFNPLSHDVCLDTPARVVAPYSWVGHIPFAFAIMSLLKPRVFVELGSHSGNSYLAFCQAVARLHLDTRCFAVDSWEGDEHAGGYDTSVLDNLRAYHDPHYSHFSTLVQRWFDDALPLFEPESIDLLHIDGLHTYDAVRHDFETWLPKMSRTGLILFHDTQVHERDFGVWQLMEELAERYPLIDFRHSHGLGVVYVGRDPMPAGVKELFGVPPAQLLRLFEHLAAPLQVTLREAELADARLQIMIEQGNAAYYKGKTEEQQAELKLSWGRVEQLMVSEQHVARLEQEIAAMQSLLLARETTIAEIYRSSSWRLTKPLRLASRLLNLPRWRSRLMKVVRWIYWHLPINASARHALKSLIFTLGAPVLRNTGAYRNWQSFRRGGDAGANVSEDSLGVAAIEVLAGSDNSHERLYASLYRQAAGVKGLNQDYVPLAADTMAESDLDLRLIAFYLPQFHPIPENDEWWGRGFTEWTNVSKAVPQFEGHYQPHLPAELGFYDLRLVDVMRRQVELAKQYGLAGFCFHYYWFAGRRLLELPLNQYIANTDLDLPFCICWANENWSRRWDGSEASILMAQVHNPETDEAFIRDVVDMFRDPRYIRVMGKPLLIVYRISLLPDPKATALRWRAYCRDAGIGDVYLVCAQSFEVTDPREYGFDAAVEFPPHQSAQGAINDELAILNPAYEGKVYDYRELAKTFCNKPDTPYVVHKTVVPSWDNEARKPGRGHTYFHANPAEYAQWLAIVCRQTIRRYPADQRLVFVNAWNEWAEGAHLEPDRRYGYAYLHATANVLREFVKADPAVDAEVAASQKSFEPRYPYAVVMHLYYTDLLEELQAAVAEASVDMIISLRADADLATVQKVRSAFPAAYIYLVQNRGRDMLPFIKALNVLNRGNYQAVCKIHGKKSLHLAHGSADRQYFFQSLLSPDALAEVVRRLQEDERLGVLAAPGTMVSLAAPDRNVLNRKWLDVLLLRLGYSDQIGRYDFDFIAGSMFWFRPLALSGLSNLNLQDADFEAELGQIDGTLPHALERLMVLLANKQGYRTAELSVEISQTHPPVFIG
ncbi:glycoside hydrolase family 99-like domain-containing protein [Chitinilyticum aquatile]|uniref:glycoside hydrolase family 99-like domain-containing protein n=1 Tax=Chitinilyticum aquatile TaxID=362520 RepID=UPI00041BBDAA|nr:glycoside hydrolase family 99-like domain-containing protein [Chitinilyticum aquatile]